MDIPVSFEYEGIQFDGVLSTVMGAGAPTFFHLYINRYYYGQLWKTGNEWKFGSNDCMFMESYMVDFFAKTVQQYLDDHANVT